MAADGSCPAQAMELHAHYIFAQGGKIEIGSENNKYACKLIITMHGDRNDPEIPMIGNKVLGVRYGQLDIHGLTRTP